MKERVRYNSLREAMKEVQDRRRDEVGAHTWEVLVDRYGEAVLFAELASIMSRLEVLVWHATDYENSNDPVKINRILDLLIDLGNFSEFLYLSILKRGKEVLGPEEKMAEAIEKYSERGLGYNHP